MASNGTVEAEAAIEQKRKREPDGSAQPAQDGGSQKYKKKKKSSPSTDAEEDAPKEASEEVPKSRKIGGDIKWKKLAAKELQDVERMSLKKLQKRVLSSAGQPRSVHALKQLLARLQGSSQFKMEDGFVRLSK
jgi:hypothetical protein